MLFDRVDTPPASEPQSAIWHFGWHVTDARASLDTYKSRQEVELLPLYTTDAGGSVLISSDTWPGTGGVPGRTRAQIEAALREGIQPAGGGGFVYMTGPDNALVEFAGNIRSSASTTSISISKTCWRVRWYQQHLNAPVRAGIAVPPGPRRCRVARIVPGRRWT